MKDLIIDNLKARAGNLNEPGKINKFIRKYEFIMDSLKKQAEIMSKQPCGGCDKQKVTSVITNTPRQTKMEIRDNELYEG